ncbi:hypothetical protein SAMN04515674_106226 [Pseudarcicella hirudinis]|uniref:Uncharacterized protein n=1 Tax=Pseudarcicella hirudinis TaxID=1079859 RepID=A0A1I5TVL1_9BACT|nr:hypothetical protein [Pseudarcicella hirudinis]SFP87120.1 hypothetical protein SAMN04515674_106226 [Pseudarcicella hirudinis]
MVSSEIVHAVADKPEGIRHGPMSLGMAYTKTIKGPYRVLNNKSPVFNAKVMGELEDPFLWKDKRGYHVVFKDHKGKYTDEWGEGVLAHSVNWINWKIDKNPKPTQNHPVG